MSDEKFNIIRNDLKLIFKVQSGLGIVLYIILLLLNLIYFKMRKAPRWNNLFITFFIKYLLAAKLGIKHFSLEKILNTKM